MLWFFYFFFLIFRLRIDFESRLSMGVQNYSFRIPNIHPFHLVD